MATAYAPKKYRRTPYGQERELAWQLRDALMRERGIAVEIDATGMCWHAVTRDGRTLGGPASSMAAVVYSAVLKLLREAPDDGR